MKRTSTVEHIYELGFDYNQYGEDFMLTYAQNGDKVFVFNKQDIDKKVKFENNAFIVSLNQEDTAKFSQGFADVEIKIYTKNKKVLINEDHLRVYVSNVINEELFYEN
jgi:hypothetical protein